MTALERAARAVIESEQDQWELLAAEWDMATLEVHGALSIARAVLMAVRGEAPTKAMAESRASDDESDFAPMLDLIDFSGENKLRRVAAELRGE